MTTYYLNGTQITEGSDITLNGFTYPYSWLEGTSPSVRASLGIEADGDINYDVTYYWGIDNPKQIDDTEDVDSDGNPIYVKVWDPEFDNGNGMLPGAMVDTSERSVTKGLKTNFIAEVKSITNTLLTPTDYYIIRNEVEGLEIPASVSTYRAAVVAEQNRVVPAIAAVTTLAQLIEVMGSINWPTAD